MGATCSKVVLPGLQASMQACLGNRQQWQRFWGRRRGLCWRTRVPQVGTSLLRSFYAEQSFPAMQCTSEQTLNASYAGRKKFVDTRRVHYCLAGRLMGYFPNDGEVDSTLRR